MNQDLSASSSKTYISQRLRLHYLDWGNAGAPPLLLLHGGRDHCRNWDWVATQLRRDWHVIAPDLRGHGDSEWSRDGHYGMEGFLYDLSQLIDQQQLAPLTLVGHSLGGNICLRYAGLFPDRVSKVVAIEGLGPSPKKIEEEQAVGIVERMHKWFTEQRKLASRSPRRYASLEDAFARMREANPHLSDEQARHLTQYGVMQNEDGTYVWKFDPYLYSFPPFDMTRTQIAELWSRIGCPALLVHGKQSWASNPQEDGRVKHFRNATVISIENAGHWVHHDQRDEFMARLRAFL